ncbi:hypothetical protein [Gordonia terrae]|uniref:hypothetical protein n=1 Tax=Gordonia terrae TaxID=2055 RepID=UPI003F6D739C
MPASVVVSSSVAADEEPPDRSRLVIAVGSNAAASVLRSKFATLGDVPVPRLHPVSVTNVTVGHSAHIARRGYVPAAPVFAGQHLLTTAAAWLGPDHVGALDATEPNYDRQTVNTHDHPLLPALADEFDIYVSRRGVLADPGTGEILTFGSQTRVHKWLGAQLDDPMFSGPPALVCARLAADPAAVTARIRAAGLVRDPVSGDRTGLGGGA